MPVDKSAVVELWKYPLTVFSILVALIIAKFALGVSFGPVSEITRDGIRFGQEQKGELANLASRLGGAIAEIDELKKSLPKSQVVSDETQRKVFEAAQTVSDQTAQVASIGTKGAGASLQQGYIWIGNYKNTWSPVKLAMVATGQPVTVPPDKLLPGTEYLVLGNMVVRDGRPENDARYFEGRRSLGTVTRGSRIRLVSTPDGIDRQFAVQYWAKVEVL